uniref:RecQ mediated genome instability protein 1 OB-fold domain-containing protein n=1 Tax=Ananas comosus var. bracteatus TaxID=296719 RepID=A0A6V7QIW4_ANACO|nr:unnamed protein product [Ananas comosus var. bracteatus]
MATPRPRRDPSSHSHPRVPFFVVVAVALLLVLIHGGGFDRIGALEHGFEVLRGKSLPDPSSLKKSSHIQGPLILQVVSVRDIYQSSIDASFRDSNRQRRLLRFRLTDGHAEVTAIEYASIPSITEEIIPGTKVRLEKKIPIHSGILLLNPKVVTVLGGLVQFLYEEWQMSQKYSVFSRLSQRLSNNDDGVGPPPFEKLQIDALPYNASQQQRIRDSDVRKVERSQGYQLVGESRNSNKCKEEKAAGDLKTDSMMNKVDDKHAEARPKEVSEAVPVQNQAAARKLLQKMNQTTHEDKSYRGHRNTGKGRQEETQVFTLEEWEKRKGFDLKPLASGNIQDVSRDEELARQLQKQLDLEDFHGGAENSEAEHIRMSMFSFGRAEERADERRDFRGRGRGRGRGRARKRF